MMRLHDAFLCLGGNIGAPDEAMRAVLDAMDAREDCAVAAVSSLYRTPPWGKLDQPDFLNAAAHIRTSLEPQELLEVCLELERSLKRVRGERWGPRVIDIDILLYDTRSVDLPGLVVPHPRMSERAFVLAPLAEIAPERLVAGARVDALLDRVDRTGVTKITEDGGWWAPMAEER
ncbi:2-amino-4-hydroxy-6-hydroxymethyldihydropteridine diphosphokinase [Nitratireductor pacificus]|uniref:2-amino-4-hydroxy-6-hydroxymethyldihydropteridine pyrophosphokinase n=1 Tax=Nitratireductor pacificus pht-3B TaxID=391937 RepID=K2ML43_9HYPH|nr:2-amino-4-hydroxy-6-hydroxymethyldihydropteridine diphosphokinase [Nitratireductor pacificus]EKF17957.1 2-amino-4-hydroxy-6-hydroxymethyldihydropteridine pyrophosphokinase [Nitratireductor pacificus pht-3B]